MDYSNGFRLVCVCVCVCVCVVQPPILGTGLHLLGAPAGVTQEEGQHTGVFYFLFVLVLHLPSAVLALSFLWREGFGSHFPSLTVKSNFVYPRRSRSPLLGVVREKTQITPRFEPATQPSKGYQVAD